MALTRVRMTVNGQPVDEQVEPRTHLADFLREGGGLTGTNLGCAHGVCGPCTLEIDGAAARSRAICAAAPATWASCAPFSAFLGRNANKRGQCYRKIALTPLSVRER